MEKINSECINKQWFLDFILRRIEVLNGEIAYWDSLSSMKAGTEKHRLRGIKKELKSIIKNI